MNETLYVHFNGAILAITDKEQQRKIYKAVTLEEDQIIFAMVGDIEYIINKSAINYMFFRKDF
jgi:hypothetical protein